MIQSPQHSPQRILKRNADPPEVSSKKLTKYHNEDNDVETRRAGINIEQDLKTDCVTPERIIRENPYITWAPKKSNINIFPIFIEPISLI